MNHLLDKLKYGLIVSCQAEGNDPFNTPEGISLLARAAVMGGAVGIRTEGIEKIKRVISDVNVPIIGLIKSKFDDGSVKITGSFEEVEQLVKIGCSIIAVDGTFRKRENLTGPEFIRELRKHYSILILADVSNLEEGIACAKYGADAITTTLSGYTPETLHLNNGTPDFKLLQELVREVKVPVLAEGRYNTPQDCVKAIEFGAWAVVVGTAITRPRIITSWFVKAIKSATKIKFDESNEKLFLEE